MRGPANTAVTFYRFDNNNDVDDGADPLWPPANQIAANAWNVTNVHEQSVDIWCSGWDGIDCISGRDSAGNLVVTWPVNPRKSDNTANKWPAGNLNWPCNNDADEVSGVLRVDEDPVDGVDNDGDGKTDEDPKEDDFGNW
jgi:hypothetical protein